MTASIRILLIEDDENDAEYLQLILRKAELEFTLSRVETREQMVCACLECLPDLVLADYSLPQFDGMSALGIAREYCPEAPYIFVSGNIGEELAVEALKQGATDYIFKSNMTRLVPAIRRALRDATERASARQAELAREVCLQRQADLVQFSLAILAETTLEGMLCNVARVACQVTGGRCAMICYGFLGNSFRYSYNSTEDGASAGWGGMLEIASGGVFLNLLTTETTLNLNDAELRCHSDWWGLPEGHPQLRGLLGARLTGDVGDAVGMIMVTDRVDGLEFTTEDQLLLTQLAALVSLGMRQLAAQKALEYARDDLELRVRERTADLMRTVASLQEEIVEHKEAVEALQKSEERYALAAIGANDGIWDWDLRSGTVYFSSRWKTILGFDEYEIHNRMDEWTSRMHPADHDRVMAALQAHLTGRLPLYREEYRMRHKDGTYRWISTRGASFRDARGQAYRMAGSLTDITDHKQAEEHLLEYQVKLRNLSAHLDAMLEKERKSISREIHDELGQSLTALRFDVKWLAKKMLPAQPFVEEKFLAMLALIDGTITTVQRIATELRPRILYDLGLVSAIEWHSAEFQKRTGIVCHVALESEEVEIDPDRSIALFRIFMESLTNVMRHAEASSVEVTLQQQGGAVLLAVKDNGRGITREQLTDSQSVGIIGMHERAHLWGARVQIDSAPGEGTLVSIVMPLTQKEMITACKGGCDDQYPGC